MALAPKQKELYEAAYELLDAAEAMELKSPEVEVALARLDMALRDAYAAL